MTRVKQKKVIKLRAHRDKLLVRATNLEHLLRRHRSTIYEIRKALQRQDYFRAYALASDEDSSSHSIEMLDKQELINELTLVYRFLTTERQHSADIQIAAIRRDYLRVAALCAEHEIESNAHEKILADWSQNHGFTGIIRKEIDNEVIV